MKLRILLFLALLLVALSGVAAAQCGNLVPNPITGVLDCAGGSGGPGNVSASGTFVVGDLYKANSTDGKSAIDAGIVAANVLTGTSLSGIAKFTSGVGSAAVAADLIALFSGTCNSTTVLGGNGACQSQSGYVLGAANLTTSNAIPFQNGTTGTLGQSVLLWDITNTGVQFGGTSVSFAELQVGTAIGGTPALYVRYANQAGDAALHVGPIVSTNSLTVGAGGSMVFNTHSSLSSPADHQLTIIGSNAASAGIAATNTGDVSACYNGTSFQLTFGSVCGTSLAVYKGAITSVTHGLDYVMRMNPVTYNWKGTGKPDLGLIADEVTSIDPLFGAYDQSGKLYNFRDRPVLATLIKAVEEQQAEIEALQKK